MEDDSGDALLVQELLTDTALTHTLVWHHTLAEARTERGMRQVDCVLLDLHLPDAAGLDAVRAIQETGPHTAIIVLTGLAEPRAGVEAVTAGAQDYLLKGTVEPELLQRAVRYAVHRKHAERASADLRASRMRAEENARLERGSAATEATSCYANSNTSSSPNAPTPTCSPPAPCSPSIPPHTRQPSTWRGTTNPCSPRTPAPRKSRPHTAPPWASPPA